MSSPNAPRPPAEPAVPGQPSTQEIPVVAPAGPAQQLPPHPGATTPSPVQTAQPTGPVGLVPGLSAPPPPPPPPAPGTGATAGATPPPPTTEQPAPPDAPATDTSSWPASLGTGPVPLSTDNQPAEHRAPRERGALVALGLVVGSLVLLELGLGLRFGGESFWSAIPLWSAFATVCAVLGLAGSASLLPGSRRPSAATGWRVAAGGLVGLAVFWLLVVLPVVAGDRGFLLTAALGCLGAALWIGPARRD